MNENLMPDYTDALEQRLREMATSSSAGPKRSPRPPAAGSRDLLSPPWLALRSLARSSSSARRTTIERPAHTGSP